MTVADKVVILIGNMCFKQEPPQAYLDLMHRLTPAEMDALMGLVGVDQASEAEILELVLTKDWRPELQARVALLNDPLLSVKLGISL